MAKKRFYAFWTYAYGMKHERRQFDSEDALLAFVKMAREESDGPYLDLMIIWGEAVEFEPATVVETWRIKETPDGQ